MFIAKVEITRPSEFAEPKIMVTFHRPFSDPFQYMAELSSI